MKMQRKYFNRTQKGFTLIESLALVAIVAFSVVTFYKTYVLAMRYAIDAKHRTAAVAFATEEMEILRNTPYEDIVLDPATSPPTGNVISGSSGDGLNYNELRAVNDIPHRILREVYYVNDPEDGVNDDGEPQDYKKVIITVLWGNGITDSSDTSHRVFLSSFFVPPSGNESAVINGALSVNVVNSDGMVVQGANVSIKYASNGANVPGHTNPLTTSSIGNVLFLNLIKNTYKITITKSGSETIETMASTISFNPMYPHAVILPGVITTMTIVMDETPDATMHVRDPFNNFLDNVRFSFSGGRIMGLNNSDGSPVFINTDLSAQSNASGSIVLSNVSGYTASIGTYTFQLDDSMSSDYVFWKEKEPGTCASYDACDMCETESSTEVRDALKNTAEITSGEFDSDLVVLEKNLNSVFVKIIDDATKGPFENVTVELKNDDLDYARTRVTDQFGFAYFPIEEEVGNSCVVVDLESDEEYDVTVSTNGYETETRTVTPDGLQEMEIILTQS